MKKEFAATERHKHIICPHCQGEINATITLGITDVQKWYDKTGDWRDGLDAESIAVAEAAEKSGVLKSYETSLRASLCSFPAYLHRSFALFMNTCKPGICPSWAIETIKEDHPNGFIKFYFTSQGVGMFTVDEEPVLFCPTRLARGVKGKNATMQADPNELPEWIRTGNGYIPRGSLNFKSHLGKRYVGQFANPIL